MPLPQIGGHHRIDRDPREIVQQQPAMCRGRGANALEADEVVVPEALGFFVAAKFQPPKFWMYVACVIEIVLAIGLIFGILTVYVGILGFLHLMVAAVSVHRVSAGRWLWNIGGCEYCLFWAICCLIVAMHYRGDIVFW